MTGLRRKIGQTMVLPVYGSDAYDVDAAQARANRSIYGLERPSEIIDVFTPAGVVLAPRIPFHPDYSELPLGSIVSRQQLGTYTRQLQEVAASAGLPRLVVFADQEGGKNSRLPVPALPAARFFGATKDVALAREAGQLSGEAAASLGVSVILSPVADIVVEVDRPPIGERSFGTEPAEVARMVVASVDGIRSRGIGSVVKHWPGHGRANADSHADLPTLPVSREAWDTVERVPFSAAIEAGADIVLAAHMRVPALDPSGTPASLSAAITGVLRDHLDFTGTVMTDALWMPAVRNAGLSDPEVALAALDAGMDMLLAPPYPRVSIEHVIEAIERGDLAEARLDQALERIDGLRASLPGPGSAPVLDEAWEARVRGLTDTVNRISSAER